MRHAVYADGLWIDVEQAFLWYEAQRAGLGAKFRTELEAAIRRVVESPDVYAEGRHGTRRVLLRRFPYQVVYLLTTTSVLFVGVMHGAQDFDSWLRRRRPTA